jgi:hypothetical protein
MGSMWECVFQAITWPPRQLLSMLPHVSMCHLNDHYISGIEAQNIPV